MEDEEPLQAFTVVRQSPDSLQNGIDQFLADGVVTSGVVVGGVFLAGNHVFRVEKRSVFTVPDFINDIGLQIDVEGSGNVFASSGFREEGRETIVSGSSGVFETTVGLGGYWSDQISGSENPDLRSNHAPRCKAPNRRYQSEHQPDRRGPVRSTATSIPIPAFPTELARTEMTSLILTVRVDQKRR